jgi:cytochrome c553
MKTISALFGTAPAAAGLAMILAVASFGKARADDDAVTRGARIAALGNARGAPACASCHAFNGSADPSGAFPRLAGLSGAYILRSLNGFAEGNRKNALMTGIAGAMTDRERSDVAAYYASVAAPVPPSAAIDDKFIETGRVIATVGLNDQQIPACAACHGPFGRSGTPTIPSLAGQYSNYIAFELQMFRDGQRTTGADTMAALAHSLSDTQVAAVGAYFQRVGSPSAPTASTAVPAPATGADVKGTPR